MTQLVNGVWGEEDTLYLAESLGWDEGWYFDGITKTDKPASFNDREYRALDFLKAAVRWIETDGGFTHKEVRGMSECGDQCCVHAESCDGHCDHDLDNHTNACMEEQA